MSVENSLRQKTLEFAGEEFVVSVRLQHLCSIPASFAALQENVLRESKALDGVVLLLE